MTKKQFFFQIVLDVFGTIFMHVSHKAVLVLINHSWKNTMQSHRVIGTRSGSWVILLPTLCLCFFCVFLRLVHYFPDFQGRLAMVGSRDVPHYESDNNLYTHR